MSVCVCVCVRAYLITGVKVREEYLLRKIRLCIHIPNDFNYKSYNFASFGDPKLYQNIFNVPQLLFVRSMYGVTSIEVP